MTMKTFLLTVCATAAFVGLGKTLDNGFTYAESGDIVPGEWNSQYAKAVAYAAENDCPIVAFWANPSCGKCNKLETAIAQSKTFADWAKERGYVLLFGYGVSGEHSKTKVYASDPSGKFPYIGLGWNGRQIGKASGSVHSKGTVGKDYRLTFSGRSEYMPGSGSDLATKFMNSCDKYLSEYTPMRNSSFAAPDDAFDRLECEDGTARVEVVLVREDAKSTLNEKLIVDGPSGAGTTKALAWAVGQSVLTNVIDLAAYTFTKDGEQLTLRLLNDEDEEVAVSHVTYVVKGNSAANPDWIGDELAFGRWTADLEGAKQFAKDNGGYTLVSIQGSLWCPDCVKTDANFLDLEQGGQNRFKAWAASKKIALVSMDIPNYTGTSVTNFSRPTLFSKEAYSTSLTNELVSGRGYLTRKGISDAEAAATLEKFHDLAYLNTDKGGFHRPEDTNPYRTGVPVFVLLKGDRVVARFTRFATVSPTADDQKNFDSYINRFEEMLTLAETDATEIANNYAEADNELAMQANGGSLDSTLCNADFQDAVKLVGLTGGAREELTISGDVATGVTVQMYRLAADGSAVKVGSERICEDLTKGISFTQETVERGTYFVLVKGRDITSDAFAAENPKAQNFVGYTLVGKTVYVPAETCAEGVVGADAKASVILEAGALYRITNVDADACAGVLKPEAEGTDCAYFTALKGGEQSLAFKQANKGFEYQIWKPGAIGFVETERTVPENINDKDDNFVEIEVARTDGSSGYVRVEASLGAESTLASDRFEFASPTTLEWADGVTSNMFVRVKVLDKSDEPLPEGDDGTGTIIIKLGTPVGPSGEVVAKETTFTLTVYRDFGAPTGRVRITGADPDFAKGTTVYVREGEAAKVWASREDGDTSLLGVEVQSSLVGLDFLTANPRDLDEKDGKVILWWSHNEDGEKYLSVSNVPYGKSAKITLASYSDSQVVKGENTVTITALDATAPYFEKSEVDETLYRYVTMSNFIAVADAQGGKLTFKKLSGSLPSGVKAVAAENGLVLVGTPTAVKSTEAVYQVIEERLTGKVSGLTVRLAFDVVDPAVSGGGEGGLEPLNDFFVTSRTYNDILILNPDPVPETDVDAPSLFGTLTLTLPRTGKASGKLKCIYGNLSYAASGWSGIAANGDYTVELACKTAAYKGSTIVVKASKTGELNLEIGGMSAETWAVASGKFWSQTESAEDYQGLYTVAMPVSCIVTDPMEYAPRGTPYLTLKMTSASQYRNGKMTWAGMLPNGQSISGSAVLTENVRLGEGDTAYLPILMQSKTDVFTAVAAIKKGANERAQAHVSEDCYRSVTKPSFTIEQGEEKLTVVVKPYWSHSENNTKLPKACYDVQYDMYGSIYSLVNGLDCCCEEAVGSNELTLDVATALADSDYYGKLGPVSSVKLLVTSTDISLASGQENPDVVKFSLDKNGIVSGSFKLPYAGGTISAKYKGVVVIGWGSDCGCGEIDLPFIQGSWYISDRLASEQEPIKYYSVKRGDRVATRTTSEN